MPALQDVVHSMKVFLAGNGLAAFWPKVAEMLKMESYEEAFSKAVKIYLAGIESRHCILDEHFTALDTVNSLTQNNTEGQQCDCFLPGSLHGGRMEYMTR